MSTEFVEVKIPRPLYERILEHIGTTESRFKTADEYVVFVLEEIVRDEAPERDAYSPEEEDQIKERLKRLGYM